MVAPVRQEVHAFRGPPVTGGLYVYGDPAPGPVIDGLLPALRPVREGAFQIGDVVIESAELAGSFQSGDIIWVNEAAQVVRSVLSRSAKVNTLLLTEQCDNRCVFCSQPPNDKEDSHLYERAALALGVFHTQEVVGLSGGEPLLDRSKILRLFETLSEWGTPTPLHILTNGRAFSDRAFLESLVSAASGRDIVWGIPLYGYDARTHDALVASPGAFAETFEGLLNAGGLGLNIELRLIPVQENYKQLPRILEFFTTHMPFVDVVSVMQLEPKGWGRKNYESLFVSARDQAPYLSEALATAHLRDVPIRLFNYPLCLLPAEARVDAVASISDWKNYYPKECEGCRLRPVCGGFFTSAQGRFVEDVEAL